MHYLKKKYILVLIGLLTTLRVVVAQHYNFTHYSTESGLAQSQVMCIAQDKNGYLWLGTLAGLSKYDGRKFINYSVKDGLIDNQIFSIITDRRSGLWIGTTGGINYFDGKMFRSFRFKKELAENRISAIAQDTNGHLWLATDGGGVCRFNGKQFDYFTVSDGLADNFVRSVCFDKAGQLWCGTKNGVCIFNGQSFKTLDTSLVQPRNISHIFRDKRGKMWFSTYGEGVYSFDGRTFVNYNETKGVISNWIRSGVEDSQGYFWFASKFGLCRFDGIRFTNFTESSGLPVDNNNIVFEDKERNIWIGSDGKGLCKFLGEAFTYLTTNDSLSSNIVLSILEDHDHNLWFSTFGKGVTQKGNGKTRTYTTDNGLNSNTIWASLKDRNDQLWFCTSDGVNRFDGKRFISYSAAEGLAARKVYAICEDNKGHLWFGTTQGVSEYDGVSFKNYSSVNDAIGQDVTSIVEDGTKALWFASKNGLYKLENTTFKKITDSNGLSHNSINSLAIDNKGKLWVGSRSGIHYYNGRSFSKIEIDNIFSSSTIYFLVFDKTDKLWIGTNAGIYVLDASEYVRSGKTKFRHYTIFDGLPGMECNQNAAFRDAAGNLWMGTTEGIIRYNPKAKDFHSDSYEPITHISGIRLFLKDTNWLKFTSEIDTITGLPQNLKVNYQTRHFTFEYIGIKLSNPSSVRYKYMLEGFDDNWSNPTDATFATYSNLSSGKYTFMVIAGDALGNWNKKPVTFNFEILPPFWTRWWFILLIAGVTLFILWCIYRLRVNALRKRHQTQQLEYQNKLMVLEQQSLNSSMNRHFIFNALNSIQYYMNSDDKASAHKYLSRFAKLIRMNLDSSMSNLVPVSEEIERLELYLQLEQMRFEDKFHYSITIADDIDPESIEIPPMLLQPFVENSIWHGILPAEVEGRIEIRIEHNAHKDIVFSIEDNGIGIAASKERKALRKDLHISRGTSITAQRIQLLGQMNNITISINGPFDLKNKENGRNGTRVELIIH
ncbi:MAG: two-component regulator propeller domain-containing protein [Sediminibacterium sp.]|nr:two-component regulator propeller domain-containing protein [Sediminibacterium sp.]